jgi:predicted nucleic acid-binding protein
VRDAEVDRILARRDAALVAPDETTARVAGRLRHAGDGDDGIDALVAAVALGDGSAAVVLTSDPRDLERLLARQRRIKVRAV